MSTNTTTAVIGYDLRSPSSPRAVSAWTTSDTRADRPSTGVCYAIAYGTERGSLHYRVYPSLRPDGSPILDDLPRSPHATSSSGSNSSSSRIISSSFTGGIVSPLSSSSIDSNAQANSSGAIVSMVRYSNIGHSTQQPQLFLVLIDDHKGSGPQQSTTSSGSYSSSVYTIKHGAFQKLTIGLTMPRMSCAAYSPTTGFVYAAGTSVLSLPPPAQAAIANALSNNYSTPTTTVRYQAANVLPNPARANPSALSLICNSRVAIVAVNNSFYAVASVQNKSFQTSVTNPSCIKVVSLTQSSQVHPAIVTPISATQTSSLIFVASGRECTTCTVSLVEGIVNVSSGSGNSTASSINNDIISLTSPILSAVSLSCANQTYVAILTTDGLVQLRLPACIAVPLRTVEVGTRPNNFYWLGAFSSLDNQQHHQQQQQCLISVGYSGDARVIVINQDTPLDLSDRLMRLAIDAFGTNGFPRSDLADALHASYSATSYIGPEPTQKAKQLLRQYLEAMLGLLTSTPSTVKTSEKHHHHHQPHMDLILCSILCLVSTALTPPSAVLANRAAKAATAITTTTLIIPKPIKKVAQSVSEALLQQASSLTTQSSISLIRQSSAPITSSSNKNQGAENAMGFVEAALWLLRAAGLHERALQVLQDQMTTGAAAWSLAKYEAYTVSHLAELWSSCNLELANLVLTTPATSHLLESHPQLGLSVFTSSHPSSQQEWMELETGKTRVLEKDPVYHVVDIRRVVSLLKDTKVASSALQVHAVVEKENITAAEISADDDGGLELQYKGDGVVAVVASSDVVPDSVLAETKNDLATSQPLYSGRDLAICFLESAIGISTGRPLTTDNITGELPLDTRVQELTVAIHEELAYFLLEGVICERKDGRSESNKKEQKNKVADDDDDRTTLGKIYRAKLRRLLAWPLFQGRAERILASLPSSFLREQAMLMGKLSRHEDALRILYHDLQSVDLALEYCDDRHLQLVRQKAARKRRGIENKTAGSSVKEECVYLPLVRVALESPLSAASSPQQSGEDALNSANERGVNAAIQVLSLRSHVIDRAAALRLLPSNIPVSAVARPFIIPALVESESEVRRYKVTASLLRARYIELKRALTEAQMISQATLRSVIKLKNLDLGRKEPLRSSKALMARPSITTTPYFPHVMVTKHFFPRFLVIQAQITNDTPDRRTLCDVAFIVAESSSEDAMVPTVTVPLKVLPARTTGSAWCVLEVTPQRLEETVLLTCELRFTILAIDVATGVPLSFGDGGGRTYVEELADLEVSSEEFGKSVAIPPTYATRERV